MGQQQIISFLEKQDKPLTRSEIAKGIGASPDNVTKRLRVLIDHHEVNFIEVDYKEAQRIYKLKRRVKVYYVGKVIKKSNGK
jgi:hypothetical protein